ncbi:hypothetical protein Taro_035136, partial [Colocasia esculenta]|nr:hypothetical protein [Colocasia esculenta]
MLFDHLTPIRVEGVSGRPVRLSRSPRGTHSGRSLLAHRVKVLMRCGAPSRLEGRRLKALADTPFPFLSFLLSPLLSEVGKAFLSDSSGVERPVARAEWWSGIMEQGGGGQVVIKVHSFPHAPLPVWYDCSVCGRPRDVASHRSASLLMSQPQYTSRYQRRRRPSRARPYHGAVAVAIRVVSRPSFLSRQEHCRDTLPRRDRVLVVVALPITMGGSACRPLTLWRSEVAVPVVRRSFSRGCSVSLVVTPGCSFPTSWRSGMLGACVVRLWSHTVAPVFRELLCLDGCVPRCCFHIVFDSTGSTGVMFGPTLSSLLPLLLEFLLLWL